jgi:hypothetical protein
MKPLDVIDSSAASKVLRTVNAGRSTEHLPLPADMISAAYQLTSLVDPEARAA